MIFLLLLLLLPLPLPHTLLLLLPLPPVLLSRRNLNFGTIHRLHCYLTDTLPFSLPLPPPLPRILHLQFGTDLLHEEQFRRVSLHIPPVTLPLLLHRIANCSLPLLRFGSPSVLFHPLPLHLPLLSCFPLPLRPLPFQFLLSFPHLDMPEYHLQL